MFSRLKRTSRSIQIQTISILIPIPPDRLIFCHFSRSSLGDVEHGIPWVSSRKTGCESVFLVLVGGGTVVLLSPGFHLFSTPIYPFPRIDQRSIITDLGEKTGRLLSAPISDTGVTINTDRPRSPNKAERSAPRKTGDAVRFD